MQRFVVRWYLASRNGLTDLQLSLLPLEDDSAGGQTITASPILSMAVTLSQVYSAGRCSMIASAIAWAKSCLRVLSNSASLALSIKATSIMAAGGFMS